MQDYPNSVYNHELAAQYGPHFYAATITSSSKFEPAQSDELQKIAQEDIGG